MSCISPGMERKLSILANDILKAARKWLRFLPSYLSILLYLIAVSGWVWAGAMWISGGAPQEVKPQVLPQQEDDSLNPPNPVLQEINPSASDPQETNPPASKLISAIPSQTATQAPAYLGIRDERFQQGAVVQTGYRIVEKRGVTSSREADIPVVKVYGPDVLTDLTRQVIQEKRPDVAIETYERPLKDKVWVEGTTGAGYMPLSPERVDRMQAARAKGGSVYSALCSQQKGMIQKTVGVERVSRRVERNEYRTVIRRHYVQPICTPPTTICVSPVNVGFVIGGSYPIYGYGAYGIWGDHRYHDYRGTKEYLSFHEGYRGHHVSGSFHRGRN